MNIILTGFKHSGKTSVGKILSTLMSKTFVDIDSIVEALYRDLSNQSLNAREIVEQHSDVYFRSLEKQAIGLLHEFKDTVIATGGGSLLDERNRSDLKHCGKMIYLKTEDSQLLARLKTNPIPTYVSSDHPEEDFIRIHTFRKPLYESCADVIFETGNQTPTEIAQALYELMGAQ